MKILILGGYGSFGGRLVELILDHPELEILVCGRNFTRAQNFCKITDPKANLFPVQLDRTEIVDGLNQHNPDLVIDASGPFQSYGADQYRVIEACIDHQVNYMDFADATDFVFGVSQFDRDARKAGVFVLSGVSSFPVLSAAVVAQMSKSMEIQSLTGGVAPTPHAGIGMNVMRAVLGYAGTPIQLRRNGRMQYVAGLTESQRFTIAVPGLVPLTNRRFSLVDVPDLRILPNIHASVADIWIGAGPEPEILHRLLNLIAWLNARLGPWDLTLLAPICYRVLNLLKFGEHRGGMFITATGQSEGLPVRLEWHLLAEGGDGPYIPSMPVAHLVRKVMAGNPPDTGARAAVSELHWRDLDTLFADRNIQFGMRAETDTNAPIYRQVLGAAFEKLPRSVRTLHDCKQSSTWEGTAEVTRGKGRVARFIAYAFGFPQAGEEQPVKVHFTRSPGQEVWTRNFAGKIFKSIQTVGTGRDAHLIVERFGPFRVALALEIIGPKLYLRPRHWSFLGLRLPQFLLPADTSFESEENGQFHFNVTIGARLIGLIVSYRGNLQQIDG